VGALQYSVTPYKTVKSSLFCKFLVHRGFRFCLFVEGWTLIDFNCICFVGVACAGSSLLLWW